MKAQVSPRSRKQPATPLARSLHAYYELTKPRVVALIVFTAIVGMFLAVEGMVPLALLLPGAAGIGLAAASGTPTWSWPALPVGRCQAAL